MVEGSLVLVQGKNGLWSSARVSALDGDDIAVKSLVTGKEVAVNRKDIFPLTRKLDANAAGEFYDLSHLTHMISSANFIRTLFLVGLNLPINEVT